MDDMDSGPWACRLLLRMRSKPGVQLQHTGPPGEPIHLPPMDGTCRLLHMQIKPCAPGCPACEEINRGRMGEGIGSAGRAGQAGV